MYKAIDEGKEPFLSKLQKYCPAPETLELKVGAQVPSLPCLLRFVPQLTVGAQVILLMNIAFHGGLVNGARGVVTGTLS